MSASGKTKVYEEVLNEIRKFIEEKGLRPGDKLPSERELAEKLQIARSSVREALRAIELLGLIETRRGEGTYMRAYRPYYAVELLSSFILHDPKTKKDVYLTKNIIELEALKQAVRHLDKKEVLTLENIILNNTSNKRQLHQHFFLHLLEQTGNDLLLKIWQLLDEFTNTASTINPHSVIYKQLLEKIREKDMTGLEWVYESLHGEK